MAAGDLTIDTVHSAGDYSVVVGTVEVDVTDRNFAIGPTSSTLLYFNTMVADNSASDDAEDAALPAAQLNMNVANTATNGTVSIQATSAHVWRFEAGIIGII